MFRIWGPHLFLRSSAHAMWYASLSWLVFSRLRCPLGCLHLWELWFSNCVFCGGGLPDRGVAGFLILQGTDGRVFIACSAPLSEKGPLSLTSLLAFLSCQCSARGHLSGPGDLWSEFGLHTIIFALVSILIGAFFGRYDFQTSSPYEYDVPRAIVFRLLPGPMSRRRKDFFLPSSGMFCSQRYSGSSA